MKDFKKILFLFTLVSIFILSGLKSNACTDQTVNFTVNGSVYQVTLCVDCTVGVAPSSVSVKDFMKLDPDCVQTLNPEDILHQIESQVRTFDYIYTILCPEQWYTPPPCPGPMPPEQIFTMYHYNCFHHFWVFYFGKWLEKWEACDYDSYCLE
jgi:hypothetical protein